MKTQEIDRLNIALTVMVSGTQAKPDQAGDELLRQIIANYKSLKTMVATTVGRDAMYTLKLKKPNIFRIEIEKNKSEAPIGRTLIVSDGKDFCLYYRDENSYIADVAPNNYSCSLITELFFAPESFADKWRLPDSLVKAGASMTVTNRIIGTETVFGIPCRVLEMTFSYFKHPNVVDMVRQWYFYIDRQNLVRRIGETGRDAPDETNFGVGAETVKSLQVDIELSDADFKFTPPADADSYK